MSLELAKADHGEDQLANRILLGQFRHLPDNWGRCLVTVVNIVGTADKIPAPENRGRQPNKGDRRNESRQSYFVTLANLHLIATH